MLDGEIYPENLKKITQKMVPFTNLQFRSFLVNFKATQQSLQCALKIHFIVLHFLFNTSIITPSIIFGFCSASRLFPDVPDQAVIPKSKLWDLWSTDHVSPRADWVKVLRLTRPKTGHFGDVLPSQSHGIVLKKLNLTQQKQANNTNTIL